jgi:hypothetical protein
MMKPKEFLTIAAILLPLILAALWLADALWGPLSDAQEQAVAIAVLGIFGAGLGWEQYRKTVPLRLMLLPLGTLVVVLLGIAAMVFFGEGFSAFLPAMLPLAIALGIATAWWIERRAKAAGIKFEESE